MSETDIADEEAAGDEQLEVQRRRYQEARRAGLTIVEAKLFADSGCDVGLLRACIRGGCPLDVLVRIVT